MRPSQEQMDSHVAGASCGAHQRNSAVCPNGRMACAPQYRILLFGGACSGKTFLARRLADALQVQPLHLDDEFWFGDWQNIGAAALVERARQETLKPQWIVEGCYPAVRETIWQSCTHVVYVEVPLWKALLRGIRRSLDRGRPGVPVKVRQAGGSGETLRDLLPMIWRYHRRKRLGDLAFLGRIRGSHVRVVKVGCMKDQECLIQSLLDRTASATG